MTNDQQAESGDVPTIVGRSSSHFTRLTRIFAAELGVPYSFRVVKDLLDRELATYGGNPALRIPVLMLDGQNYFGSLNICRRFSEMSPHVSIEWPEDLAQVEDRNACEVVLQAMSTGVSQIMASRGGVERTSPYCVKLQESLDGSLRWLESYVGRRSADSRFDVRYLDMALLCLVSHLVFKDSIDLTKLPEIRAFVGSASSRQSVKETAYCYD